MKRIGATLVAIIAITASLGLVGSSLAQPPTIHSCDVRLKAGERIVTRSFDCGLNNPSVYVFANGRQLTSYDQSRDHNTADWYGSGVVVRLHARGNTYTVRTVSVYGTRVVRVQLVHSR